VSEKYTYSDAELRYQTDATYRAMVDSMLAWLDHLHLTPGELRDAAMLAALKFEAMRVNRYVIRDGKFEPCD
jgi:hypothetical protein